MSEKELRRYSQIVVDGNRAGAEPRDAARGRFSRRRFQRPQIGIASTWSMVTPCNMHIGGSLTKPRRPPMPPGQGRRFQHDQRIGRHLHGHPGMRYSLVSREIIADSIEAVAAPKGLTAGCDRRLRQEHAGLRHGHGAAQPPACSSMAARSSPAPSAATSFRYSRPSAPRRPARSMTTSCSKSSRPRFRARAPAAACTRPTRWHRQSRPSA